MEIILKLTSLIGQIANYVAVDLDISEFAWSMILTGRTIQLSYRVSVAENY